MTLLTQLNPYARWIKLAAIALACAGLVAAGWTANGWRLGQAMERKEAARQTALTERQQKAMQDALQATLTAQGRLEAARAQNAANVKKAAHAAPTAPEYACREKPLPEDYLEHYRK